MKIAYLMHYMKKNFEEITENLDVLINQGDDVYLMVNDDDLRDDLRDISRGRRGKAAAGV